jgi:glycosyltransferase involved in cell wall biosynthesis
MSRVVAQHSDPRVSPSTAGSRGRIASRLLSQRARENPLLVHGALLAIALRGSADAAFGRRSAAVDRFCQVHRTSRVESLRRILEPYIAANRDVTFRSVQAEAARPVSSYFGTRIAVLKEPRAGGERGVLFVMFSETLPLLFASMNMDRLLRDYTVIIEPSWSGYCDPDFLRLTQLKDKVYVLAAQNDDFAFLERLRSNLVPVRLGPCDWVNPEVAEPYLDNPKEFDIVMNAHWGPSKRHHVLFRFLKRARRKYSVVLIGGSWEGNSIDDVCALAEYYGVRHQLTVHERLPYQRVMDLTCRARVSILLSLKEGSNRAIAESMFCNVPVVVLDNHVGGIIKNVVPETGLLVPERALESAIERLRDGALEPRRWALSHISCFASSAKLNSLLRAHALETGRPWTEDIAVRSNSPESRYVFPEDEHRLAAQNARLIDYAIA